VVNNLNDAVAWGIFPLLFAAHGLTVSQIGVFAALYPAVWGAGQLDTGWYFDRVGRGGYAAEPRRCAAPGRRWSRRRRAAPLHV
jgi:MFS family permease